MKLFCTLALLLLFLQSEAQTLVNYSSTRNTGVAYNSINSTGSAFASWRSGSLAQDDNRSVETDIGFDFWYLGVRYTQFCVSTNGFLDFSNSGADGGPLPYEFGYENSAFTANNAAYGTRPAIAPLYDDLTAQGNSASLGASIKYLLSGIAPNRTLTIEWINMSVFNNTTPSLNFQVKLVETSGQIIINYDVMNTGTNIFSYCTGLNAGGVSYPPTTAELKELQTANINSFSNGVQNNLSTMPLSNSQYIFTPIAPTAVSGSLSFSSIGPISYNLNWPNWATNEIGYVIYNSTDGINYNFIAQTASNTISYNATNLIPSTTYSWKVYAVTEGSLGAPLNGVQSTSAAGIKTATTTNNWSNPTTWSPYGVPTASDNVTIANGHLVSANLANMACNNLIVGQGSAATLLFTSGQTRSLTVNNITVNNSAVFSATPAPGGVTHALIVKGDIVNNGTINFAPTATSVVNLYIETPGNHSISGNDLMTKFNRITESLGSVKNVLEINTSNFSAIPNFLTLNSGTFKMSTVNSVNITPFTSTVDLNISKALWLNSPTLSMSIPAGVALSGNITINSGTLNIGDAVDESLIVNGGSIDIAGGVLKIAGNLDGSNYNNVCDFNMSGGMVVVPTFGSTSTSVSPFHISSAGSKCTMTGGTIVIERSGGGAQNLGFYNVNTDGPFATGGTLQIGNASTPASQTIAINTNQPIQNLLVNSGNATARLNTNTLTVNANVNIAQGTLDANNMGLNIGGNWNNTGAFTPGTSTVIFNGNSSQTISKTGGETFYAVGFAGVGTKTLIVPITANNNFSVAAGAGVDVSASNFSVTVKGNFINSGVFNARSGLLMLNGVAAQNIGGSSTTDFFDLTLNNSTGASLINAENLKGTLTLSNGTFNTTGQVFTMLSDAANTARIAQITGTGDFTGNATIQRFAPGGITGWALLGSPISSALTLNDWDDDTYISCNTCPDGSAAGFPSIYTYNETATGLYDDPASYVPLSGINDPIIAGKGYWTYLGNGFYTTTDITLDLTGTPRKFNYSIPLTRTNTGLAVNDGWNLICNPYPSPISWSGLRGSTTNIDNAIYVYNADLNGGTGGFASYVNGYSSPAVNAGGIGDAIPMGQGFYVHSTGATVLAAQESNKIASNQAFLRPPNVNTPLTRLTLMGANAYTDETVLYFEQGANNGFDVAYDSYKMRGQDPTAASIALEDGTDLFQINGITPVVGNFTMALKTLTGISGTYTITANNINSFPNGACISLYDKFTAITTDLKTSDYSFSLEDTTSVSRFILSITMNLLNITANTNQPSCAQPTKGRIIAIGNSVGPWNYYWTSNGAAVKTSLNKNSADTLENLSNGVFDLSINTIALCDNNQSNYSIDQQIQNVASFASVDTLLLDNSPFIQFTNTSLNSSSSYWDFGTGQDYSTVTSPAFLYTSPGTYTVTLIAESSTGCKDTAYKQLSVLSGITGLNTYAIANDQYLLKSLDNNLFVLQTDLEKERTIHSKLNDATGKLIMDYGTQVTKNLNLQVNLKEYAHGIYFLILVTDSGTKVIKLPVR